MSASPWPVEIRPVGAVSCGTVLWRYRGRLQLTAIVKATFALVSGGPMFRMAPDPIHRDDLYFNDDRRSGIAAASDLAPYRISADVVVTGEAFVPRQGSTRPRIAITRGKVLLDKSIHAAGDPRVAAFGPIPQSWPIRRRLLGSTDPRALAQSIAEFPSDFDWTYFQAAPPDQRIDYLRGDEWIALENLHPSHDKIRSQIPQARAAGKLYGPGEDDKSRPLLLHADTLHIEPARGCCSLVWRSCIPLPEGSDASRICVLAGIETAGQPMILPRSRPADELPGPALAPEMPRVARPIGKEDMTATMPLDKPPQVSAAQGRGAALPGGGARPRHSHGGTLVMDDPPAGSAPPPTTVPATRLPSPHAGTVILEQTALVSDDATFDLRAPFAIAAPGVAPAAAGADIPGAPWSPQPRAAPLQAPDEPTAFVELPAPPEAPPAPPEPLSPPRAAPPPEQSRTAALSPTPEPVPEPVPVPAAPPPAPGPSVPGMLYQRFAPKKKGSPP